MYLIICYELKYTLNCADIQMGKLVKYFIDFSGRIARRVKPCLVIYPAVLAACLKAST